MLNPKLRRTEIDMNGASEEQLIRSILRELERDAERRHCENKTLLKCLFDCVGDLSKLRERSRNDIVGFKKFPEMSSAEEKARMVIAPHLKGLTKAQEEDFCSGRLNPDDVLPGVSGSFVARRDPN